MKAVVLAAGKGIRMLPLTEEKPKSMIELKGRPLLQHVLEPLAEIRVKEAVVVVGYKKEKIIEFFGSEFQGMKLAYVEQKEQKGTAHALGMAKNLMNEDFIMRNADTIAGKKLFEELKEMQGFDAIVAGRYSSEPWKYGCLKVEGNKLIDIIEKPEKGTEPTNLVNAGIYRFSPKIFNAIEKTKPSPRGELELTDSIKILIEEGCKVGFLQYEGKFLDIGSIEDLKKAEES